MMAAAVGACLRLCDEGIRAQEGGLSSPLTVTKGYELIQVPVLMTGFGDIASREAGDDKYVARPSGMPSFSPQSSPATSWLKRVLTGIRQELDIIDSFLFSD